MGIEGIVIGFIMLLALGLILATVESCLNELRAIRRELEKRK